MKYDITFSKPCAKEIELIDNPILEKIWLKIETFSQNPRPSGCQKLRGFKKVWRVRVGAYRILYSIDDSELVVKIIAVKHRKDVYK